MRNKAPPKNQVFKDDKRPETPTSPPTSPLEEEGTQTPQKGPDQHYFEELERVAEITSSVYNKEIAWCAESRFSFAHKIQEEKSSFEKTRQEDTKEVYESISLALQKQFLSLQKTLNSAREDSKLKSRGRPKHHIENPMELLGRKKRGRRSKEERKMLEEILRKKEEENRERERVEEEKVKARQEDEMLKKKMFVFRERNSSIKLSIFHSEQEIQHLQRLYVETKNKK